MPATVDRAPDPAAICPGCGHPMADHIGPDGELVGIPMNDPQVDDCLPVQTERERLWDLNDRGFIDDAAYAAALAELDARPEG